MFKHYLYSAKNLFDIHWCNNEIIDLNQIQIEFIVSYDIKYATLLFVTRHFRSHVFYLCKRVSNENDNNAVFVKIVFVIRFS